MNMDIKKFLMPALVLTAIGAGGSVFMYYQTLRLEHVRKKKLSDTYFSDKLYELYDMIWTPPYDLGDDEELAEINKLKEQMRSDGYLYAEIAVIDRAAYKKAHDKAEAKYRSDQKQATQ